jgi:1-acyl-sn-glycerol-3-phosphate acyltransferase
LNISKAKSDPIKKTKHYDHQSLEFRRRFLRFLIRWVGFSLLAKLDRIEGLENVPMNDAAILMINHIAFIDPIVVIHTLPRNIVPLAKAEVYEYPFVGIFPRLWDVIPVKRDEFDRHAVQQVMNVLRSGEIVLVAPEGTRGPKLRQAKVGVAYLASRSEVPVIPVAITGTEGFPALRFTAPWRTPGAVVRFGKPIRFLPAYKHASSEQLRKMTDEAMYLLAEMLPPERRGYYSDLSKASLDTIIIE